MEHQPRRTRWDSVGPQDLKNVRDNAAGLVQTGSEHWGPETGTK